MRFPHWLELLHIAIGCTALPQKPVQRVPVPSALLRIARPLRPPAFFLVGRLLLLDVLDLVAFRIKILENTSKIIHL